MQQRSALLGWMTCLLLLVYAASSVEAREAVVLPEVVNEAKAPAAEIPLVEPPAAPAYIVPAGRSPLAQAGETFTRPIPYPVGRPKTISQPATMTQPAGADSPAQITDGKVIKWQEADQYLGQTVTVEGRIVDTFFHTASQNTFLNFSKNRQGTFYLIMFRELLNQFPQTPDRYFLDKSVRVTGVVVDRNGRPQIQVRDKNQIQIVE